MLLLVPVGSKARPQETLHDNGFWVRASDLVLCLELLPRSPSLPPSALGVGRNRSFSGGCSSSCSRCSTGCASGDGPLDCWEVTHRGVGPAGTVALPNAALVGAQSERGGSAALPNAVLVGAQSKRD
eukprot:scaffold262294_cov14-Tisochrysis_lutea.AAC.1